MKKHFTVEWHKYRIDELIDGKKRGYFEKRKIKKKKKMNNYLELVEDEEINKYIIQKYEKFNQNELILEYKRVCRKIEILNGPFNSNEISISIPVIIGVISIITTCLLSFVGFFNNECDKIIMGELITGIIIGYLVILTIIMQRTHNSNKKLRENFEYFLMIKECLEKKIIIKNSNVEKSIDKLTNYFGINS